VGSPEIHAQYRFFAGSSCFTFIIAGVRAHISHALS
jgi:hypothetical protein